MKKIFALLLSLALVLSLSATALAAGTGDHTGNVTGTYKAAEASDTVYSVDIIWEDLSFTYTAAGAGTWDPETLAYKDAPAASWAGEGTITVKNRSNAAITATPSYAAKSGYETASVSFDKASLTVATAEGGTEQTGTIKVTPSGSLPEDTDNAVIGTITLTIA